MEPAKLLSGLATVLLRNGVQNGDTKMHMNGLQMGNYEQFKAVF